MTSSERMVTWGLLGLIVWELWPKQPAQAIGFQNNPDSQSPSWLQQLSYAGLNEAPGDITDSLLAIPQGPGGLPNAVTNNFFNPAAGYGGLCTPPAPSPVGPSSQVFASPIASGAPVGGAYVNPFGIAATGYNMVDIQVL